MDFAAAPAVLGGSPHIPAAVAADTRYFQSFDGFMASSQHTFQQNIDVYKRQILYGIRNGGSSNGKGGNILAGASPDTSALQMYYFDGESVAVRRVYDSGQEKELIRCV